jgi:hypothetical protein
VGSQTGNSGRPEAGEGFCEIDSWRRNKNQEPRNKKQESRKENKEKREERRREKREEKLWSLESRPKNNRNIELQKRIRHTKLSRAYKNIHAFVANPPNLQAPNSKFQNPKSKNIT